MTQDSATPAEGQQVISCVACIYRMDSGEPEVMLARRSMEKKFYPGKLEMPGGHIDFGEPLEEGLKRELKEELSIEVELGKPFDAFSYINNVKKSHSVEIVYAAKLITPENEIKLQPKEHTEIIWIKQSDLPMLAEENGEDDEEYIVLTEAFNRTNLFESA